LASRALRLSRQ